MEKHENIATVPDTLPLRAHWSPGDIPYGLIEPSRVADDTYLFYMVAAASLVEVNSDLYTRNLLEYFHDDAEISDWLVQHWQHEEVNHGIALKRYVYAAWPAFDWDRARRRFDTDYTRLCRADRLGPTRALELAARCVVETGTASLYTMLSRLSPEPVLTGLFSLIRSDEVRHYRYFYHFLLKYRQREAPGQYALARTLWRRVKEVKNEDAYYAFKHVYLERHPARRFDENTYRMFRRHYLLLARRYYPYEMAVRMFVKPLGLGRRFQRIALPLLAAGAKHIDG